MGSSQIDFWFTMGSTYSFLSVMRLAKLERSTGLSFRWRPFHLLIILQEMKHVPFADKPTKSAYMWRDIERRAAMYGIPVKHRLDRLDCSDVPHRDLWRQRFARAV